MTQKVFADLVRFYTNTDSVTFVDADILLLSNTYMLDIAESIVEANEDFFITPATTNLVADQREYPFPVDMLLKLKRVEITFESGGTPILAHEVDLAESPALRLEGTSESLITSRFSNNVGLVGYDIARGSMYIYSGTITSVTAGLKLWFASEPAALSDLTEDTTDMSIDPDSTSHGFPKPFHEILARRVSIFYKSHADRPIPLTEQELSYQGDLAAKIAKIKNPNLSRAVIRSLPDTDQDRFGYNGYNL